MINVRTLRCKVFIAIAQSCLTCVGPCLHSVQASSNAKFVVVPPHQSFYKITKRYLAAQVFLNHALISLSTTV